MRFKLPAWLRLSPVSAFRFPVLQFVLRFGLYRGIEFSRVAARCDRDPHRLREWETHYRTIAFRHFHHDDPATGRVYLAFAEMLSTTHDKLIRKRKAQRRPLVSKQARRIERALARSRQMPVRNRT